MPRIGILYDSTQNINIYILYIMQWERERDPPSMQKTTVFSPQTKGNDAINQTFNGHNFYYKISSLNWNIISEYEDGLH